MFAATVAMQIIDSQIVSENQNDVGLAFVGSV
jgi:hypothetical protein